MDREWRLGEDVHPEDSILDGITFEELIVTVKCNCEKLTPENAKRELKQILEGRLEDMYFLFEKNLDVILAMARSRRNG